MPNVKKKEKRGLGYLYKRDAQGREHPAKSKVPGNYWLAMTEPDGHRVRRPLVVDGKPVTDYKTAQAEQMRLRIPIITHSQVEALRAQLLQLEGKEAEEDDLAHPPLTIDKAWRAFEQSANRPECGADTMRQHKSNWLTFVSWLRAENPKLRYLREITEELAGQYMTEFGQQGITANTYNKRITFFRLFFRVLAKPARIAVNPFADLVHRRQQAQNRRELSMQELRAVLLSSEGEMQRLFWIGTFTGLRLGDCCTLRWAEVDLFGGIIRRIARKTSRSGKPPVLVGIPPPLYQLLSVVHPKSGYVCPTYAARYLKSRSEQTNISREIQQFLERCGITTTRDTGNKRKAVVVGFHSLRHTYASIHAENGTPQPVIQDNLGHSNPAMTEHYQHISEEAARKAAAVLDFPLLEEDGGVRSELLRIVQTASVAELDRLMAMWREVSQ